MRSFCLLLATLDVSSLSQTPTPGNWEQMADSSVSAKADSRDYLNSALGGNGWLRMIYAIRPLSLFVGEGKGGGGVGN